MPAAGAERPSKFLRPQRPLSGSAAANQGEQNMDRTLLVEEGLRGVRDGEKVTGRQKWLARGGRESREGKDVKEVTVVCERSSVENVTTLHEKHTQVSNLTQLTSVPQLGLKAGTHSQSPVAATWQKTQGSLTARGSGMLDSAASTRVDSASHSTPATGQKHDEEEAQSQSVKSLRSCLSSDVAEIAEAEGIAEAEEASACSGSSKSSSSDNEDGGEREEESEEGSEEETEAPSRQAGKSRLWSLNRWLTFAVNRTSDNQPEGSITQPETEKSAREKMGDGEGGEESTQDTLTSPPRNIASTFSPPSSSSSPSGRAPGFELKGKMEELLAGLSKTDEIADVSRVSEIARKNEQLRGLLARNLELERRSAAELDERRELERQWRTRVEEQSAAVAGLREEVARAVSAAAESRESLAKALKASEREREEREAERQTEAEAAAGALAAAAARAEREVSAERAKASRMEKEKAEMEEALERLRQKDRKRWEELRGETAELKGLIELNGNLEEELMSLRTTQSERMEALHVKLVSEQAAAEKLRRTLASAERRHEEMREALKAEAEAREAIGAAMKQAESDFLHRIDKLEADNASLTATNSSLELQRLTLQDEGARWKGVAESRALIHSVAGDALSKTKAMEAEAQALEASLQQAMKTAANQQNLIASLKCRLAEAEARIVEAESQAQEARAEKRFAEEAVSAINSSEAAHEAVSGRSVSGRSDSANFNADADADAELDGDKDQAGKRFRAGGGGLALRFWSPRFGAAKRNVSPVKVLATTGEKHRLDRLGERYELLLRQVRAAHAQEVEDVKQELLSRERKTALKVRREVLQALAEEKEQIAAAYAESAREREAAAARRSKEYKDQLEQSMTSMMQDREQMWKLRLAQTDKAAQESAAEYELKIETLKAAFQRDFSGIRAEYDRAIFDYEKRAAKLIAENENLKALGSGGRNSEFMAENSMKFKAEEEKLKLEFQIKLEECAQDYDKQVAQLQKDLKSQQSAYEKLMKTSDEIQTNQKEEIHQLQQERETFRQAIANTQSKAESREAHLREEIELLDQSRRSLEQEVQRLRANLKMALDNDSKATPTQQLQSLVDRNRQLEEKVNNVYQLESDKTRQLQRELDEALRELKRVRALLTQQSREMNQELARGSPSTVASPSHTRVHARQVSRTTTTTKQRDLSTDRGTLACPNPQCTGVQRENSRLSRENLTLNEQNVELSVKLNEVLLRNEKLLKLDDSKRINEERLALQQQLLKRVELFDSRIKQGLDADAERKTLQNILRESELKRQRLEEEYRRALAARADESASSSKSREGAREGKSGHSQPAALGTEGTREGSNGSQRVESSTERRLKQSLEKERNELATKCLELEENLRAQSFHLEKALKERDGQLDELLASREHMQALLSRNTDLESDIGCLVKSLQAELEALMKDGNAEDIAGHEVPISLTASTSKRWSHSLHESSSTTTTKTTSCSKATSQVSTKSTGASAKAGSKGREGGEEEFVTPRKEKTARRSPPRAELLVVREKGTNMEKEEKGLMSQTVVASVSKIVFEFQKELHRVGEEYEKQGRELQRLVAAREKDIADLQAEMGALRHKLEDKYNERLLTHEVRWNAERELLLNEKADLLKKREELSRDVKELSDQLKSTKDDSTAKKGEIDRLSALCSRLEQKFESNESLLLTLEAQRQVETDRLHSKLEESRQQQQMLEQEVDEISSTLLKREAEAAAVQKDVEKILAKYHEFMGLPEKTDSDFAEISTLKTTFDALLEKALDHQTKNKILVDRLGDLLNRQALEIERTEQTRAKASQELEAIKANVHTTETLHLSAANAATDGFDKNAAVKQSLSQMYNSAGAEGLKDAEATAGTETETETAKGAKTTDQSKAAATIQTTNLTKSLEKQKLHWSDQRSLLKRMLAKFSSHQNNCLALIPASLAVSERIVSQLQTNASANREDNNETGTTASSPRAPPSEAPASAHMLSRASTVASESYAETVAESCASEYCSEGEEECEEEIAGANDAPLKNRRKRASGRIHSDKTNKLQKTAAD